MQVFPFFRESIRQAGHAPHSHADAEVLALDMAGANPASDRPSHDLDWDGSVLGETIVACIMSTPPSIFPPCGARGLIRSRVYIPVARMPEIWDFSTRNS